MDCERCNDGNNKRKLGIDDFMWQTLRELWGGAGWLLLCACTRAGEKKKKKIHGELGRTFQYIKMVEVQEPSNKVKI